MASSFGLLRTRRFLPLFLVQFLGAFNDDTFKNAFIALLTYRLADQLDLPLNTLIAIMGMLFIIKQWDQFFMLLGGFVLLSIGLYFTWFKHLNANEKNKGSEGALPEPAESIP